MKIIIETISLFFTSMLIKNVILNQFLGMCPFLGVSKKIKNAQGMGIAVFIVLLISSLITWTIYNYILCLFIFRQFYKVFINFITFFYYLLFI